MNREKDKAEKPGMSRRGFHRLLAACAAGAAAFASGCADTFRGQPPDA
jgi:hypothetical protein